MDLSRDFDEAAGGIEVLSDRILVESFDSGQGQSGGSEFVECAFDQLPADACSTSPTANG